MASKLLIVRPTMGQGGADRVTLTLLQNLDRSRFAPSLALMQGRGPLLADLPADVPLHILSAGSLWTAWWPLIRLLHSLQPDILFSTSSGTNVIAAMAHAVQGQGSRLVLSERNMLGRGRGDAKQRLLLWLKQRLYRRAHAVLAVSAGVRDDLVAKLGLDPVQVTVVYNPVVTDDIQEQAAEAIDHLWFDQEIPVMLGVGRLVAEKDFATLLRAFAQVCKTRPARLVILGEGPLRLQLTTLIQELSLQEQVWLPGFVRNPFQYMARCTLFVLSSRFEGLPGVLIQAMACGAPVISTDCPSGPAEIITPEVDGLLVPTGDVAALAAAMERLLAAPDLRQRLGEQARRSAQRFQVTRALQNYELALTGGRAGRKGRPSLAESEA